MKIEPRIQEANYGKNWTDEEIERALDLSRRGVSLEEAAESLGRTPGAVLAKLETITLQREQWSRMRARLTRAASDPPLSEHGPYYVYLPDVDKALIAGDGPVLGAFTKENAHAFPTIRDAINAIRTHLLRFIEAEIYCEAEMDSDNPNLRASAIMRDDLVYVTHDL